MGFVPKFKYKGEKKPHMTNARENPVSCKTFKVAKFNL